ncbi:O-antigen ligase family protein [Breznakia sp. OttesenSCG-928-G09]|nr:O-antigen ligase family protein [Breznakia sp. OttesenSCG-928-G09]
MKRILANYEKIIVYILVGFIVIQPFLDIRMLFTNPNLTILGTTIPTIIRCLVIGVLCLLILNDKRLPIRQMLIYFGLVAIYFVIHHFITRNVTMPESYSYSLFGEIFYTIRLILPLLLIVITRYSNLKYEQFRKMIIISSLIIGGVIVISNSLYLSITSYMPSGAEADATNTIAWYQWFNLPEVFDYPGATSKGWFFMANQISGVMSLLLLFNIYDLVKSPKILNILSSLLLIMAMLLIGTRVASYGWIVLIAAFVICMLICRFLSKTDHWQKKGVIWLGIIVVISSTLLFVSPIRNRNYDYDLGDGSDKVVSKLDDDAFVFDSLEEKEKFILDNYLEFKIQDTYIMDIYPYTYDPDFWISYFKTSQTHVIQNREAQELITSRIVESNSGVQYKLFGMSFSRFRNGGLYLERDFVVQYYTIGIIGILLFLSPYIIFVLYKGITMLKDRKNNFTLFNCVVLLSVGFTLCASVLSGHLYDELIFTIYLGLIIGFSLKKEKVDMIDNN